MKGDEKLPVSTLREGFYLIFTSFFLEKTETIVAIEQVEQPFDLRYREITDAKIFWREVFMDGAAVSTPVRISFGADNNKR